jgi:hypothetical protein
VNRRRSLEPGEQAKADQAKKPRTEADADERQEVSRSPRVDGITLERQVTKRGWQTFVKSLLKACQEADEAGDPYLSLPAFVEKVEMHPPRLDS